MEKDFRITCVDEEEARELREVEREDCDVNYGTVSSVVDSPTGYSHMRLIKLA